MEKTGNSNNGARAATNRELKLLANIFNGKRRFVTQDERRLADWSKKQLEQSLDAPVELQGV